MLGHNLTLDRERESALEIMTAIHANWSEHDTTQAPLALPGQPVTLTFAEFVPIYLQYLKAKRPKNDGRNQIVLTHHLIPHFGNTKLSDIRLEDGLAYLEKRRSVLIGPEGKKRHVAPGTIERECAALMAVLN